MMRAGIQLIPPLLVLLCTSTPSNGNRPILIGTRHRILTEYHIQDTYTKVVLEAFEAEKAHTLLPKQWFSFGYPVIFPRSDNTTFDIDTENKAIIVRMRILDRNQRDALAEQGRKDFPSIVGGITPQSFLPLFEASNLTVQFGCDIKFDYKKSLITIRGKMHSVEGNNLTVKFDLNGNDKKFTSFLDKVEYADPYLMSCKLAIISKDQSLLAHLRLRPNDTEGSNLTEKITVSNTSDKKPFYITKRQIRELGRELFRSLDIVKFDLEAELSEEVFLEQFVSALEVDGKLKYDWVKIEDIEHMSIYSTFTNDLTWNMKRLKEELNAVFLVRTDCETNLSYIWVNESIEETKITGKVFVFDLQPEIRFVMNSAKSWIKNKSTLKDQLSELNRKNLSGIAWKLVDNVIHPASVYVAEFKGDPFQADLNFPKLTIRLMNPYLSRNYSFTFRWNKPQELRVDFSAPSIMIDYEVSPGECAQLEAFQIPRFNSTPLWASFGVPRFVRQKDGVMFKNMSTLLYGFHNVEWYEAQIYLLDEEQKKALRTAVTTQFGQNSSEIILPLQSHADSQFSCTVFGEREIRGPTTILSWTENKVVLRVYPYYLDPGRGHPLWIIENRTFITTCEMRVARQNNKREAVSFVPNEIFDTLIPTTVLKFFGNATVVVVTPQQLQNIPRIFWENIDFIDSLMERNAYSCAPNLRRSQICAKIIEFYSRFAETPTGFDHDELVADFVSETLRLGNTTFVEYSFDDGWKQLRQNFFADECAPIDRSSRCFSKKDAKNFLENFLHIEGKDGEQRIVVNQSDTYADWRRGSFSSVSGSFYLYPFTNPFKRMALSRTLNEELNTLNAYSNITGIIWAVSGSKVVPKTIKLTNVSRSVFEKRFTIRSMQRKFDNPSFVRNFSIYYPSKAQVLLNRNLTKHGNLFKAAIGLVSMLNVDHGSYVIQAFPMQSEGSCSSGPMQFWAAYGQPEIIRSANGSPFDFILKDNTHEINISTLPLQQKQDLLQRALSLQPSLNISVSNFVPLHLAAIVQFRWELVLKDHKFIGWNAPSNDEKVQLKFVNVGYDDDFRMRDPKEFKAKLNCDIRVGHKDQTLDYVRLIPLEAGLGSLFQHETVIRVTNKQFDALILQIKTYAITTFSEELAMDIELNKDYFNRTLRESILNFPALSPLKSSFGLSKDGGDTVEIFKIALEQEVHFPEIKMMIKKPAYQWRFEADLSSSLHSSASVASTVKHQTGDPIDPIATTSEPCESTDDYEDTTTKPDKPKTTSSAGVTGRSTMRPDIALIILMVLQMKAFKQ